MRVTKLLSLLLVATIAFSPVEANAFGLKRKSKASTEQKDTTKKASVSKYDKNFTKNKDCKTVKGGFITIHCLKQKVYAELPVEYFGRDMLISTTISEISDNALGAVGYKTQDPEMIRFVQGDSTVFMTSATVMPDYDPSDTTLYKALSRNFRDPVIGSYKRFCKNNDESTVVFDVTPLFMNNYPGLNPIPDGSSSGIVTKASYIEANSEIQSAKAFEDNVTVKSLLSYKATQSVLGLVNLFKDKPVSVVATRTLLLLPEKPARERISDSRVGIFLSNRYDFSADADMCKAYSVVNRWDIAPSDTAAWLRGEKVKPVKPIIFYLDDAFPAEWRKPAKEGIMRWNAAFEAIGFKDVVQVLDYPTDNPDFDPDNLKYSCIRFVPQRTANAMGPSWTDPRSGEIINASVIVYSDIVKLLNNWRFCQTAQVDERVRAVRLPQDVIDESIAYVLAHEVGHCLGFMHNMAASSAYSVESLRDPEFTQKYGTTPSIMDYARFNYVAQVGDKGVRMTPPDLGIYDYFLVKYAYEPILSASSAKAETDTLESWVNSHTGDKRFRYGRQQVSQRYDPSAIEEDLGDDAMKAGDYGIKNLQYLLQNLDVWFTDENDPDGSHRMFQYNNCLSQYKRYVLAAMMNIGGIYLTANSAKDAEGSVVAVPKKTQKEALQWVTNQIDNSDCLHYDSKVNKLSLRTEQSRMMAYNLTLELLDTYKGVVISSHVAEEGDAYTVRDWANDVYNWTWKSTIRNARPSSKERMIQKLYINDMLSAATKTASSTSATIKVTSDETAYLPSVEHILAFGLDETGAVERYAETLRKIEDENGREYVAKLLADNQFGTPGYGWQTKVDTKTIDETPAIFYGEILKVQKLLRSRLSISDADTRAHYESLLYSIDTKLNNSKK